MKKVSIIVIVAVLAALTGCGQGRKAGAVQQTGPKAFVMPELPPMYAEDPEKAAAYMADHFWDNFDFADTAYVNKSDITEQAFADYVYMLAVNAPAKADESLRRTFASAQADSAMFAYFTELSEKYLYDPNSPMRNEDMYISVLRFIIDSDKVDELEKIRPRAHLEMALKNRVGDKAADFAFMLADGRTMRLYDIKKDYTLLFINNPDCTACAEIIEFMKHSDIIMPLVRQGRLAVVAVYPDEDLEAWHNHRGDMAPEWINGYDASLAMRDERLYDLKAIPTLYLLDKDKKVLIKDAATAHPVEMYFQQAGY